MPSEFYTPMHTSYGEVGARKRQEHQVHGIPVLDPPAQPGRERSTGQRSLEPEAFSLSSQYFESRQHQPTRCNRHALRVERRKPVGNGVVSADEKMGQMSG